MKKPPRNIEPRTLAEKVAARGEECLIPFTHDRLHEAHHWWHEMARYYHEPEPFRYALGAFVQAARNVTFMLQKEKAVFDQFDWYDAWVEQAKRDAALCWLNDARTDFVHRQALEPDSSLEMRCLGNPRNPHGTDDDPLRIHVSPFECTHYYMHLGPTTDHGHEFTRHWGLADLKDRELLGACADVYDQLDALVHDAHKRVGRSMPTYQQEESSRALPCMRDVAKHRVARTIVRDGREVWEAEPPGLHGDR